MCRKKLSLALGISMLPLTIALLPVTLPIVLGARYWTRKKQLDVDHCHTTGEVRGLLCNRCNTGIGQFKDNPNILRSAARYLDKEDA